MDADLSNPDVKPVVDHVFTQRLYPATFLKEKIIGFGFSSCEIWGDYDGSAYNQNAKTMLLVARK